MSEGSKFSWGISGAEGDVTGNVGILLEPSLICFSGRAGKIGLSDLGVVINAQDYINLAQNGTGTLQNTPLKKVYFARDVHGYTGQMDEAGKTNYDLYIEYDIVTLTVAEQADLYQRGLGCC